MRKQTIHGIFAVMLVILALMATGCVDDGTPNVTPSPKSTPKQTSTFTPTPVITYQDSEYAGWIIDTAERIISDQNQMASAAESAERFDCEGVEVYSRMLYDDAKKALNEIDQFFISPRLKPSKDEFKLALQNYKQAGYYGEKGARNHDANDLKTSIDYLVTADIHFREVIMLPYASP